MKSSRIAILLGATLTLVTIAGVTRTRTVEAQEASQAPPSTAQGPPSAGAGRSAPPPFDPPNPRYRRDDNWAQIPGGAKWGVMSAVDIDSEGNVYVLQRSPPKIMVFDSNGKFLRSWGEGLYEYAHGLRITPDGKTMWVTDRKGQVAYKYDLYGKLLMTLGKKDVIGGEDSQDTFSGIADVVVGKDGNLFITDGEEGNNRVVKLTKDGKFIKTWGTKGTEPGNFRLPHEESIDSRGRLWVTDRNNKRIQLFDQDGNFLEQMTQFGPASAIYIKNDLVYVADVSPNSDIMIATLDGKILDKIPGLFLGHGIVPDAHGSIYLADGGADTLAKFIKVDPDK